MSSGEHGYVHRDSGRVGFVQANAKVPLSTQEEEDEDPDMDKTYAALICPGFVQVMQDGGL